MQKAPVTVRSVIQRINRRLKPEQEMLKTTRGRHLRNSVGDYYIVDFAHNWIKHPNVDPEQWGRELGVLHEWEEVVENQ
jgi:hypothetical protein